MEKTLIFVRSELYSRFKGSNNKKTGFSGYIYDKMLFESVKGFYTDIFICGVANEGWWPKLSRHFFIQGERSSRRSISASFINLPVIRDFLISKNLFTKIKKHFFSELSVRREINIIVCNPSLSLLFLSKKMKILMPHAKIILAVPDLPQFANTKRDILYLLFKKRIQNRALEISAKYIDGFVFLTKYMVPIFNKSGKPYIISEGISRKIADYVENKQNRKTIVYTGETSDHYSNIDTLLNSYALVRQKIPDAKLIIAGNGNNNKYLLKKASEIGFVYKGLVSPEESLMLQKNADLLVSLRKNSPIFKYSFPSKILSYLSTGNPVLTIKLDSYPDIYDQVLSYPDSESCSDISKKMIFLLNLCESDRKEKWIKTKNILEQSGTEATGKKVLELFNSL